MNPRNSLCARTPRLLSCLVLFAIPALRAQNNAPPPAPANTAATAAEEAIVLSPFQVDAGSDKGYMATQTLSGTRLKTDLKDVGSSLTIFLASYPGVFPAGLAFSQPVSSLDIFATCAALTGAKSPSNLDGANLTPYLSGEKTTPPHDALFFSMSGFGAVRQGPWKLVLALDGTPALFDLSKDIEEKHDLAATESARVKALTGKWQVWHAQMPPPPRPSGKTKPSQGKNSDCR